MIKEFLFSLFVDPTKDLTKLKFILKRLHDDVYSIGEITDPVIGVVRLYNVVSRFEDDQLIAPLISKFKSSSYGQHSATIEMLEKLDLSAKALGRDLNGKNRTVAGQIVTPDDIYLSHNTNAKALPLSSWTSKEGRSTLVENEALCLIKLNGKDIVSATEYLLKIC